jgi:hypothetical protein
MFEVFDSPVNSVSAPRRDVTIVAPQTLWSLNNRRAFRQAQELAARLLREAPAGLGSQVDRAWMLALGRTPTDAERSEALALINALAADTAAPPLENPPADLAKLPPSQAAALAKLCLALFNLNEFMFID